MTAPDSSVKFVQTKATRFDMAASGNAGGSVTVAPLITFTFDAVKMAVQFVNTIVTPLLIVRLATSLALPNRTVPDARMASSSAPGMPAGVQFVLLSQSPVPVQTFVPPLADTKAATIDLA